MKLFLEDPAVVFLSQVANPYDNFYTRNYLYPYLKEKGVRILDLGCGSGRNSVALASMGYDVVGVDHETKCLKLAAKYAKEKKVSNKVKFINKNILRLKKNELGLFDICILQEVIEHVEDYQKIIDVAYNSLKKNGILLLTTQHDPEQWNILDEYAQHIRRFTKKEILDAVKNFSYTKITITGFPFMRLLHFIYCTGLKFLRKEHNTREFISHSIIFFLYNFFLPFLLRIDQYFDFTELGSQIIVYAEK